MDCELCGLPTPMPPLQGDGHAFCCYGCREVYLSFGNDVLATKTTEPDPVAPQSPEGAEAFLRIDGMHCSSCEILIERTAVKVNGILSATASYATSTAKIIYDPDRIDVSELPGVLNLAGYRARLRTDSIPEADEGQALLRLFTGVAFSSMVMMLSIAFIYPIHLGWLELRDMGQIEWIAFTAVPIFMLVLTTVLVFYVGAPILRGAWIGLRTRMLNMDNLMAIAILGAYGYSIGQLVAESRDLYFDVAAMIVAVVTIGRHLEQGAKARATIELTNTIEAWTPTARVWKDGELRHLAVDELEPGDHVFIWEGEAIPVNGTVVSGQGAVDESLITGEPFPVVREQGEGVLGGAIVIEGTLEIEVGSIVESQMDNIARILWSVQSSTSGIRGIADRVARVFVPMVIVVAVVVTGLLLLGGVPPREALLAGLATLIVSCPCTFGLAIPMATAVGVSTALRHGIIFTSADIFEKAPRFDIVAIDKTGTLSTGEMTVAKVIGPSVVAERAAAVERMSPHPIAEAIARLDSRRTAADHAIYPGKGAVATVDGLRVAVGSRSLFAMLGWAIPNDLASLAATIAPGEGVVSYVGWEGQTHGAIVTQDQHRPEWEYVVDRLQENSRIILLTGAEHPSGYEDRVDKAYVGVPPEGKAAVIRRLRSEGTVVMIGDGSNDAPALVAADLGIAFGAPTALAADAADVVIPGDRLDRIFIAFDLIASTRRRIRQNIAWAFLYNATAIPLAVTGYINPLFAALAMAASSLLVVWNSSRPVERTEWMKPPTWAARTRHRTWSRLSSSK